MERGVDFLVLNGLQERRAFPRFELCCPRWGIWNLDLQRQGNALSVEGGVANSPVKIKWRLGLVVCNESLVLRHNDLPELLEPLKTGVRRATSKKLWTWNKRIEIDRIQIYLYVQVFDLSKKAIICALCRSGVGNLLTVKTHPIWCRLIGDPPNKSWWVQGPTNKQITTLWAH